ncbi:hypothetical protein [Methanomassiliicoccus luminyensis]|uniref:hypothetical protein n=1 Tax=Methanomassiliicoccus luminyensis TaxID=1080712 RepID=UPI0003691B32|nr:hypothetical protein [Methanomassiliicoccus luminyensis]
MNEKDIDKFEKLDMQLYGFYEEVNKLSQKKPDEPINKFKLKLINQLLKDANVLLGKKYAPLDDFNQFDENLIPSNSDVSLIIAQYLECMDKLRLDNIKQTYGEQWYWIFDGNDSKRRAIPPRKKMKG